MKKMACVIALVLLPSLGLAHMPDVRTLAKAGFHQPKRAIAFVEKLRSAVLADDAPAIAKMLSITFGFTYDGVEHPISPAAFIKDYASIMNSDVRKAILEGVCAMTYQDALSLSSGRATVFTAGNGGRWEVLTIILDKE